MNEIIFSVTSAPEGGFLAQALGHSIYEVDDWPSLRKCTVCRTMYFLTDCLGDFHGVD